MSRRWIWFRLLDAVSGQPYKNTLASKVCVDYSADLDDFRKAVKAEYDQPNYLKDIPSGALIVYRNKAAFDQRQYSAAAAAAANGDKGMEEPLDPTLSLMDEEGLGSKGDMLVVTFEDSLSLTPSSSSYLDRFLQSLKLAGINTDSKVSKRIVDRIASKHPNEMIAVAGSRDACYNLYWQVSQLPSTVTLGVIRDKLDISINGPLPGSTCILTAIDRKTGKRYLIKLLSRPHNPIPSSMMDPVECELEACSMVSNPPISGLVHSEVVEVDVEHSDGISVSPGRWRGLKMRHFISSLTETAQLSEYLICREYERMKTALQSLHALNLVHMDIKSDNVLVDEDGSWSIADFGSCRRINTPNFTFTDVFNPYRLVQFESTVIPAMDFVLLIVMVAVELDRKTWKARLCEDHQRVQHDLIIKSLCSIQDSCLRDNVLCLYKEMYEIVVSHLKQ